MVTDSDGYVQLIEYLTEHLSLFEQDETVNKSGLTVIEAIEQQLSEQIIAVCNQNKSLSVAQRSLLIREVDSIVYDLEEVLSGVVNQHITAQQQAFINEFAILIKNLFDSYIQDL